MFKYIYSISIKSKLPMMVFSSNKNKIVTNILVALILLTAIASSHSFAARALSPKSNQQERNEYLLSKILRKLDKLEAQSSNKGDDAQLNRIFARLDEIEKRRKEIEEIEQKLEEEKAKTISEKKERLFVETLKGKQETEAPIKKIEQINLNTVEESWETISQPNEQPKEKIILSTNIAPQYPQSGQALQSNRRLPSSPPENLAIVPANAIEASEVTLSPIKFNLQQYIEFVTINTTISFVFAVFAIISLAENYRRFVVSYCMR